MEDKIIDLIKNNKITEAKIYILKKFFANKKKYCYYMGLCYCAEKKFSDAIKYFEKAKKYGLEHYLVYYNLGTAYIEMNDFCKAKINLLKSIELNKDYYNSYLNLAYIYIKENDLQSAYRIIKSVSCMVNEPQIVKIEENIYKELIK